MNGLELILKYGKASNTLGQWKSKPFIELPFGLVKIEVPNLLSNGKIQEAIEKILSIQYSDFKLNHSQKEIIAFTLWIREQLDFIHQIETTYLHSEPEPELLASGVHRLDEFGALATIDHLAGGDLLKHKKIKVLPYFEVYQKLKLDKIQTEIKKQYEKIITEKAKRKY